MIFVGLALAIPREDALATASRYATHVWTATEANQYADCSSDYESNYAPGTYTGLPYDWGGYMSLDEFDAEIAAGYGAGSHSWHGSLSCTAGVDCSGYVSMVWASSHVSTSTLYTVADEISWSELERADAINDAGSHVVLFTHLGEGDWPVWWESSGGADKVHINNSSGWSYIDGYVPNRFEDIEDGSSTGTADNPRSISAFPFEDHWWTPGAASDEIDVYSCSDADESGPEVLYRFETTLPGTLTAVVSDESGVDIDLHVLESPDGDRCLGRDDTELSVHVEAGEVWLSLDTYVGSREYSGAYLLTVDFEADAGAEPEPGDGGDSGGADSGGLDSGEAPPPPADFGALPGQPVGFSELGGACGCGSSRPALLALLLGLFSLRRAR